MKNYFYLLITMFMGLSNAPIQAQETVASQGPTLITRSETMIEVLSIAAQMDAGTFIPSENRIKEFNPKRWGHNTAVPGKGLPKGNDPLWQKQTQVNQRQGKAPILAFEAASASATPTDPTGAVGPNHFINSWNSSFRIWDKAGNPLTAPASLGTILPGTMGDPIVIYDPFADRFLITEFYSNGFDVAISKGPNPVTSGWYVYRFPTNTFPDYPKFTVWSDGYYITANKDQSSASTSQVVFALERDKMIAGNTTAQMLGFPLTGIVTSGFYSPMGFNANGPAIPPAGNAPIVYMQDDAWSGVAVDHLKIWSVNVNWTTPGSSTISSPQIINTAPFDGLFDGGSFSNLPQPSGSDIDALQATIMYMAQYRRFPTYNTVVFNFVVDLTNADNKAGIRWYELRQTTDGAPWTIYQEGTYSQPNGHSAFCGNMCMDINGNIGMAYTVVSTTQNPALRFTGRFASDPLGTMLLTEEVIKNGTSVDPSSRYGDYAQMTVDPVDGTSFWSIGEVFLSGRKNWVGVFQIAPPALTAQFSGTPTTFCAGGSASFTDQSLASPTSWTWSFPGGTPSSWVGQTPPAITYSAAGTFDVTLTVSNGSASDSETKTGYITVKSVIANFTGAPTTVVVGNTVTFTDISTCNPITWTWSFPGGTPSSFSGQTPPPVSYSTIGTYDVSLTVTKPGGTDTKTRIGYISVIAPVFNITSGTVTTCSGTFYDSGGPSANYQDNEVFIETFNPSTPGAMLRFNFTSFSTELNYDTLTIYNGATTAAPIIGKYHGTLGPAIVTATNSSGSLTFRFRSDVSIYSTGWVATISCVTGIVADPASFSATTASSSQINLAWAKNATNNDVMIAWSPTSSFGTPVDGTIYAVGGTIAGGGTVLYKGSLTAFSHTALSPNTTYYYKAWSCNGSNAYSAGLSKNAKTFCGVYALPFTENFPTSALPGCWAKQISGTGGIDKWTVSGTANAGGTAYEMKSMWQSVNPGVTRLVTPPLNSTGISQLNLSFRHMLDGYATGCTLRIQSSTNGSAWTNEAWSLAATASNVGPALVSTTIVNNVNSPTTFIAFTIEGDLYQYDYWYIDAVTVTNGCLTTYPVSVSITPSVPVVCEGTSVTFTAVPVNGGSTPAYQWKVNANNVSNANNATYSYIPVSGDVITCQVTSNALCITGNPAMSNSVTMVVSPVLPVSVAIEASANPVDAGTPVTFTATPVNGGTTPAYQWKVNAINVSNVSNATNATYSYVPANGDMVFCTMTSGETCTTSNPANSNTITMVVNSVNVITTLENVAVTATECFDALQTIIVAGDGTTFSVVNGGSATMIAGQNILYYPGTLVEPGGYLYGYIAPGGPWCSALPMPAVLTGQGEVSQFSGQQFFRIYPNPTSGTFILEAITPHTMPASVVEIYNMNGEKLVSKGFSGAGKQEFNLADKPAGIYLVRVVSEGSSSTARIVKQ